MRLYCYLYGVTRQVAISTGIRSRTLRCIVSSRQLSVARAAEVLWDKANLLAAAAAVPVVKL